MRDDSIATVRPQEVKAAREALMLVPRKVAEQYRICPLALSEGRNGMRILTIASADPTNIMLQDQLQQMTRCRIQVLQATEQDIMRGIDLHYSGGSYTEAPTDLLQQMGAVEPTLVPRDQNAAMASAEQPGGASGAVEQILMKAVNERATDVHLEPHAKAVYVRFRIDGMMYDSGTYDPSMHPTVISRIKVLSGLDIAQNRLPQDGRFDLPLRGREFDVRVSTVPAVNGEKAVLRLLPKGANAMDFAQLGLAGRNRAQVEELTAKPFGLVLVTGPTGSGKTTTLYACLTKSDCVGKNVITVEDPVEYQFPRITQIQVHPKIGLTFAAGLRSILRQDPDVIMVGEIRDLETLEMAIQSALTGHLVLSTLHCNDAAAAAARMIDMGAEPFLVATSVNGIVAQRLVRRVCESCRVEAKITDETREKLDLPNDGTRFYTGTGCAACRGTGYVGRVSVYEVMPNIEPIQRAIMRKASASEVRTIMRDCGIPNLRDDGLEKARAGITSLEEVMRAVYVETL